MPACNGLKTGVLLTSVPAADFHMAANVQDYASSGVLIANDSFDNWPVH
jgi:hypothetical protein